MGDAFMSWRYVKLTKYDCYYYSIVVLIYLLLIIYTISAYEHTYIINVQICLYNINSLIVTLFIIYYHFYYY